MKTFNTQRFAKNTERNGGYSTNHRNQTPDVGYMIGRSDLVDTVIISGAENLATNSRFQHEAKNLMTAVKALNTLQSNDSFYLGSWIHEGKVYLDVSQKISDRAEAMELAVELGELAIWDVRNSQEISVN